MPGNVKARRQSVVTTDAFFVIYEYPHVFSFSCYEGLNRFQSRLIFANKIGIIGR